MVPPMLSMAQKVFPVKRFPVLVLSMGQHHQAVNVRTVGVQAQLVGAGKQQKGLIVLLVIVLKSKWKTNSLPKFTQ